MQFGEWEIYQTNYPYPDIKHGQHTNGPARVWVRVDGEWVDTGSHTLHRVRRELESNGTARICAQTWNT